MRKPDFVIGPKDNPYLKRWWVIPRNRWFNIYLHQILKSDDDRALHDHPWWNVSIVLKGGYVEVMPVAYWPDGTPAHRNKFAWRGAGSIVFRKATAAHRLEICREIAKGDTWTLFITGPNIREWGFWCPKGWKHWKDFVSMGNPGEVGPGCEG